MCPLCPAGEKNKLNFNKLKFAKLISQNSETQVILVKSQNEMSNYFKKHLLNDEIEQKTI